ncbi:MAG: DUF3052 domain-containing protein [Bacteroidota bacterium]
MKTSGYSGTPLAKKLGIKEGFTILLVQQPEHYFDLFMDLPRIKLLKTTKDGTADFIHFFSTHKKDFEKQSVRLKSALRKTGMLWISWPKGSSKIPTDLSRDYIREYLLSNGLVDVKVCAVDGDWSGLKFVYRLKDRE